MDKQTEQNLLNIVKRNYQDISGQYNETRKKELSTRLWHELIVFCKSIPVGSKILDVGCGNGRLLKAFKGKKIEYLGIDNSEELIDYARANYPLEEFRVGDILNLSSIPHVNYDYVVCAAVLHHLPGEDLRVRALLELKNKVSAQGKIFISIWNVWNRQWQKRRFRWLVIKSTILKIIGQNKMDFGDILFYWKNSKGEKVSQRYYHAFRKGELRRIAKKAGLKIERLYKDKYNYYLILTR